MSSITNIHKRNLKVCTSYESLNSLITTFSNKNILPSMESEILETLPKIESFKNIEKTIFTLAELVVTDKTSSTSYNILLNVCEKYLMHVKSSGYQDVNITALLIVLIVGYEKSWYHDLPENVKSALDNEIKYNFLVLPEIEETENIKDLFKTIIAEESVIDGIITSDETQPIDVSAFNDFHKILDMIFSGNHVQELLSLMIGNIRSEKMQSMIDNLAISIGYPNVTEMRIFLGDIMAILNVAAGEMEEMYKSSEFNSVMVDKAKGKFIIEFIKMINLHKGQITSIALDSKYTTEALRICINILKSDLREEIINFFTLVLNEFKDKQELGLLNGSLFDSVKNFMLSDPVIKAYMTDCYPEEMPTIIIGDDNKRFHLIKVLYSYLDIESEPATEASKDDWSKMDVEEEDNDSSDDNNDNQKEDTSSKKDDYKPEIVASQDGGKQNKISGTMATSTRKIYAGYKKFQKNEGIINSQLNKMRQALQQAKINEKGQLLINGKTKAPIKPITIIRMIVTTGAIFAKGNLIGAILALIIQLLIAEGTRTRVSANERRMFAKQLDDEIRILEEKIEDARGDGNRQAKYALMRTKNELEGARDKIKYNLASGEGSVNFAVKYMNKKGEGE